MTDRRGRRGQIVNTTHSHGRGVMECWWLLFQGNEKAFRGRRWSEVLEDEEILDRMVDQFPDRAEFSKVMQDVRRHRAGYNRGIVFALPGKYPSRRYIRDEEGRPRVVNSRGRKLK